MWRQQGRPCTGWLHDTYVKKRSQYHYAVKRAKASSYQDKAEKLLAAALQGDTDLLSEMKKIRKGGGGATELPDTVGGANGESEIVEKFKLVYSSLYNSASSEDEMKVLFDKVHKLITPESVQHVARVTGSIVKEAVCSMKPRKSYVSGTFTSDILFEQLSVVVRCWLTHGKITPCLQLSTSAQVNCKRSIKYCFL